MSTKAHLDSLLQQFTDGGVPGCALQIAQRNNILYEGYFGSADLQAKTPVKADSLFRQASLTKLPLYVTLMMLFERGAFVMSDPIHLFFPEWKHMRKVRHGESGAFEIVPTEGPVTVRDVFTMACGLPYCIFPSETDDPTYRGMMQCMQPLWQRGHYTLREQIAAIADAPLAFEPGTRWMYGFASELAAGIIEAVCAKPAHNAIRELLLDPLDMQDTRAHYVQGSQQRMVCLYQKQQGRFVPTTSELDEKHRPEKQFETGFARLFATVSDYTKLMQMLANGGIYRNERIIGRKTIDLMRTNALNDAQQRDFALDRYNAGYSYGYGVRTLTDHAKGNHNGSHGAFGWTGGFGTWAEADPNEGLSIVYMHNMVPSEEYFFHLRVRTAAYGLLK